MRIVLTTAYVEGAGITTYCENLAEGLNDAGHEVILLTGSTSRYPSEKYKPPKAYKRCVFLKQGISTAKNSLRKYIKAVEKLNPDVLIINNSTIAMASLPFIPWKIIRIPVIHNIREAEVRSFLAMHFWWDRAVCVSPLIARVARGLPGSAKLHVCPLGIKIKINNARSKKTQKNSTLSLVWAGRVHNVQKRADLIPKIAQELENRKVSYHWTIHGDGTDLKFVIKSMERMGIENKFSFTGLVTRQRVLESFKAADILVMPSDYEGLPQALLEAMSMGVVPVVSKIPGSTEYLIRDGVEGLLCKRGEPESFAEKISMLEQDRLLLSDLSIAASRRVGKEFNHHAFANRILLNIDESIEEGIARDTPLNLKLLTTKIPEMKDRTIGGLLYSFGIHLKYKLLKHNIR